MLHTNVAELLLLFDTFTRVWSSGGQASVSLQTKDGQVWAKLDLQLGPADGHRPGLPEAGGSPGAEPVNHQEQLRRDPHLHPQARRRGPAARARDARRQQDWLQKRLEPAQDLPESRTDQEQIIPEQEDQDILVTSAVSNTETEMESSASDKNTDVIPQLDGTAEAVLSEKDDPLFNEKKETEPVVFKMLDNGYAETRTISSGEKPPARVFHPELRMGTNPKRTEWGDRVWIEYVFEVDNVQMEMYQVI